MAPSSLNNRAYELQSIKVADGSGNSLIVSGVVTFRVVDSARAALDMTENLDSYVRIQARTSRCRDCGWCTRPAAVALRQRPNTPHLSRVPTQCCAAAPSYVFPFYFSGGGLPRSSPRAQTPPPQAWEGMAAAGASRCEGNTRCCCCCGCWFYAGAVLLEQGGPQCTVHMGRFMSAHTEPPTPPTHGSSSGCRSSSDGAAGSRLCRCRGASSQDRPLCVEPQAC